jgi:hypothetical protein
MRLQKAGYITALIPEAFVYHRRKASFYKFYKQLYFHGKGRIDLHMKHGDALKLVHLLPSFFVLYLITGIVISLFIPWIALLFSLSICLYILAVLADASIQNKNFLVGILSIVTSLELLVAYGIGVIRNIILRMVLKRGTDSKKDILLKE